MNSKFYPEMEFDQNDSKNIVCFSNINQRNNTISLAETKEHSLFYNLFKQDD
jgi:hypothetical protein